MEQFTARIRYEEPAFIEEYVLELARLGKHMYNAALYPALAVNFPPKYKDYRPFIDFYAYLSKYLILKNYHNPRWKSLRQLPPKVFYNTIQPAEQDLEWKIMLGPYSFAGDKGEETRLTPILEDLKIELSKHSLFAKEGVLEALLGQIVPEILEKTQNAT